MLALPRNHANLHSENGDAVAGSRKSKNPITKQPCVHGEHVNATARDTRGVTSNLINCVWKHNVDLRLYRQVRHAFRIRRNPEAPRSSGRAGVAGIRHF
jgi:hypothetical protein